MSPGIANARMYSIDAATAAHWRTVLQWVLARAAVPAEIIDYPAPAPLPALWARADLTCAFMCGYPLAHASPQPVAVVAPVPSPSRYGHSAIYWSDIVVRADAPWRDVGELIGRRVASTRQHSQSGYQAPRRFFADYAAAAGTSRLFEATVGPLTTPLDVMRAIADGAADVGAIDSYAHDLLRKHRSDLAAQVRAIAQTARTPIPPFVASAQTPPDVIARLRDAFLAASDAPELDSSREALLIEGFERVATGDYEMVTRLAREADALGYPRLE